MEQKRCVIPHARLLLIVMHNTFGIVGSFHCPIFSLKMKIYENDSISQMRSHKIFHGPLTLVGVSVDPAVASSGVFVCLRLSALLLGLGGGGLRTWTAGSFRFLVDSLFCFGCNDRLPHEPHLDEVFESDKTPSNKNVQVVGIRKFLSSLENRNHTSCDQKKTSNVESSEDSELLLAM